MGIVVRPREDGEPIEKMIRRFKNQVKSAGVLTELKKHEFYEKPTDMRRRKKKEVRRANS